MTYETYEAIMGPLVLVVLIGGLWLLIRSRKRSVEKRMKALFCPRCGFKGKIRTEPRGYFIIEAALWLFFILPGLIYSIWRQGDGVARCPACSSKEMIPADSPIARKMIDEMDI
ncbi:MAG: hypothetical protein ABII06_19695 [Pseudomonadota bacterium]